MATKRFKVKPGNNVSCLRGGKHYVAKEGEEIELPEEDAANIPWAVEPVKEEKEEKRRRL